METQEHQIEQQHSPNRLKRLGFGVLGAWLATDGAKVAAFGALVTPLNPVFGLAVAGFGSALSYGGYRAFKHAHELPETSEAGTSREARLTRVGRYLGGAAIAVTGAVVTTVGVVAAPGALAAGLWVGGWAATAYAAARMYDSFELQPAGQESPSAIDVVRQGFQAVRDKFMPVADHSTAEPFVPAHI